MATKTFVVLVVLFNHNRFKVGDLLGKLRH